MIGLNTSYAAYLNQSLLKMLNKECARMIDDELIAFGASIVNISELVERAIDVN